ncbi:MAG: VOC family protein [Gammaproteobacteria bacterium]
MKKPAATAGMRHVALNVRDLKRAEAFYVDLLGMQVEWRPDAENVYLTSGNDNLALHKTEQEDCVGTPQRLDHIGFILSTPELVDEWYEYLLANDVEMKSTARSHRDGARSFYCSDPEGVIVQMIYHPPIA